MELGDEPLLSGSPHPLVQRSPSRRVFLEQVAIFNVSHTVLGTFLRTEEGCLHP